jgi:hypothetical protein
MKPWSIILNRREKGAGQGTVRTGHTRTCFLLTQGCTSGLKFCEKMGFGEKPSHLNMRYFHEF